MKSTSPGTIWVRIPFVLLTLWCAPLLAQCSPAWTGDGVPGTDGEVDALVEWDPDGPGPLAAHLVVAGAFSAAGDVAATNIAMRDPVSGSWSAIGAGLPGWKVSALAVTAAGDLVAASWPPLGSQRLLQWDGTSWVVIGSAFSPFNGNVTAMLGLQNGDLIVGGSFSSIEGVAANNIARWDGSAWHALGGGLTGNQAYVRHLLELPNGDVLASGNISAAGGVAAAGIARWDGAAWAALGTSPTTFAGGGMVALPNGDLIVHFAGGLGLQRYDGVNWSQEAPPINLISLSIERLRNGDLVVGGSESFIGGVSVGTVGVWDGVSWSEVGDAPVGTTRVLLDTPSGLVAGGDLLATEAGNARSIALWNETWSSLGTGVDDSVWALLETTSGELFAGGSFESVNGVLTGGVARIDSSGPAAVGGVVVGTVHALAELPNGDLVVGGNLSSAGGVAVANVARWDGTAWSQLGAGLPSTVHGLAVLDNGDLIAGGIFAGGVRRWDGTSWQMMPGLPGNVWEVAVLRDGTLVAAGSLVGSVWAWGGGTWAPLGGGYANGARSLAPLPDGGLLVAGYSAGVALWDGAGWQSLGSASSVGVEAAAVMPDGSFVVGGRNQQFEAILDRYDGSTWSPVPGPISGSIVYEAFARRSGELVIGGRFGTVAGVPAANLARWEPPCPASVAVAGSGCAGSGGPNELAAVSSPWIGGTFVAAATGMPALGVAVGIVGGTGAAVNLPTVTALALPGCSLLVSPDVTVTLVPNAGSVDLVVPIPAQSALVGQTLHTQVVAIGLSGAFQVTELTSTNALVATVGGY